MGIRSGYRWFAITSLTFSIAAVNFADRGVFGVVAPRLIDTFHFTESDIGFIAGGFGFGFATLQLLVSSAVVRKLGARLTITLASVLWSIFLGLMTVASSVGGFFGLRLAFGAAESPNWPAMQSLLSRWFPQRETERAFNFSWAGIPVGSIFGPPLAVALVGALDWRAPFYVLGLLGVALGVLLYIFVSNDPESSRFVSKEERADIVENRAARMREDELAARKKVYRWRQLLTNRHMWLAAACSWTVAYLLYLQLTFFPLYLTTVRHIHYKSIGWLVALPYVAAFLGGVSMSTLSDKMFTWGHRYFSRTLIPGLLCAVAGVAVVAAAAVPSTGLAIVLFAISAFSQQASNGVINATAVDLCPEEPHLATQMIVGAGSTSSFVAPIVSGALIAAFGSYLPAFVVAGGLTVVTGVLVLLLFRPKPLPLLYAESAKPRVKHLPGAG